MTLHDRVRPYVTCGLTSCIPSRHHEHESCLGDCAGRTRATKDPHFHFPYRKATVMNVTIPLRLQIDSRAIISPVMMWEWPITSCYVNIWCAFTWGNLFMTLVTLQGFQSRASNRCNVEHCVPVCTSYNLALLGIVLFSHKSGMRFGFSYCHYYAILRKTDLSHQVVLSSRAYNPRCWCRSCNLTQQ